MNDPSVCLSLRRILQLKCLRRVLLLGFGSDAKQASRPTQEVATCLPAMAQSLQQLLAAREVCWWSGSGIAGGFLEADP